MQIFYTITIDSHKAILHEEEAKHCSRVLRHRVGDEIHVTDGNGALYFGSITEISKKEVYVSDLKLVEKQTKRSELTIAMAPTKNIARFEWFLEKATEIGIGGIIPIITKRSERKVIKPERCHKILLSAMKQSKNFHLPILHPLVSYNDFMKASESASQKYIAHCMEPEKHLSVLYNGSSEGIVMIGPEGDFTPDELKLAKSSGWMEVSLGESRLRTETAGIVATHIVSMLSQNIKN